jgi:hypothetical protein
VSIFQLHQALPTAALDKQFIRTNPNQRRPLLADRLLVGPVTYIPSLLGRGARTLFRTLPTKPAGGTFWFHSLDLGLVIFRRLFIDFTLSIFFLKSHQARRYDDMRIWILSDLGANVREVVSLGNGKLCTDTP